MRYRCPYCNDHSTLSTSNYDASYKSISIDDSNLEYDVGIGLTYMAVACPNPDCKKLRLEVSLSEFTDGNYASPTDIEIEKWKLLPESVAKPQPDYIPASIVNDYKEACRIKDLSPKASATLARRALQGMIRDYFNISKPSLYQEIDELKNLIPLQQWEAIDALRKVGNIGAHMEQDINVIVDIEPHEAERLITFLEYLFEQWYVKSHDDDQRLQELTKLAGIKKNKET